MTENGMYRDECRCRCNVQDRAGSRSVVNVCVVCNVCVVNKIYVRARVDYMR